MQRTPQAGNALALITEPMLSNENHHSWRRPVGGTLAEHLAREENDITVVDTDGAKLRELHTKLDIRTVTGAGSYPIVLRRRAAKTPIC